MNSDSYPYVVFLPSEQKNKILSSIFGSKAAVGILRFSLTQSATGKIYQKDVLAELDYSNKTIIENLKLLTQLGVLSENMEKTKKQSRTVWVKAYKLSDVGMWFALLLAEDKDLTQEEKADILQKIFRRYITWVRKLSTDLNVRRETLREIFEAEMK